MKWSKLFTNQIYKNYFKKNIRNLLTEKKDLINFFLYFIIFNCVVFYYVIPVYSYAYVFLKPVSVLNFFINSLVVLPILYILFQNLPKRMESPSHLALNILYITVGLSTLFFEIITKDIYSIVFSNIFWSTIVSFSILFVFQKFIKVFSLSYHISCYLYIHIVFTLSLIFLFLCITYIGMPKTWVEFDQVYNIRENFTQNTIDVSRHIKRLIAWGSYTVAPFAFNLGVKTKNKSLIFISILFTAYAYNITGNKIYLFSFVISSSFYIFFRFKYNLNFNFFIEKINFFIIFSLIIDYFFKITRPLDMVRRSFLCPGMNTSLCFDFFEKNPKIWFSNAPFLSEFLTSPYPKTIGYILGSNFYKNTSTNANVSFLGDAYANGGVLSVVFITFLLGITLWVFDCIAREKDRALITASLLVQTLVISETGIQSALFGSGFFLLLIFIYFLPKDESIPSKASWWELPNFLSSKPSKP